MVKAVEELRMLQKLTMKVWMWSRHESAGTCGFRQSPGRVIHTRTMTIKLVRARNVMIEVFVGLFSSLKQPAFIPEL